MGGDAEGVPLHPTDHRFWEHHFVARESRNLAEPQHDAAHLSCRDVDHMPPVHVQLVAKLGQASVHRLRRVDRQPRDLDVERRRTVVGPNTDHDHVAAVRVFDEEKGKLQAGEGGARSVRQIGQGRRRQAQPRHALAGQDLLQGHRRVVRRDREAADGHPTPRLS